jgi:hypothetical protein
VLMFGSKAIAGYPDARVPVHSPSLKVLYEKRPDGIEKLAPLMTEIFQCQHFNLLDSPIQKFASAMLAAFLRFYHEFEKDMGVHNPILVRFHEIVKKCQISIAQIRVWSNMVREQFESDNFVHKFDKVSRANNEIVNAIVHMHQAVLRLEETNRHIVTELDASQNENKQLKSLLEDYRRENVDNRRERSASVTH